MHMESRVTLNSFQMVFFLLKRGIVHCSSPISAPWPFPVNLLELAPLKNEIHLSPSGKLLIFFLSLNESKIESHYSRPICIMLVEGHGSELWRSLLTICETISSKCPLK